MWNGTEELPGEEKNWNDLPPEMKQKCIGKMDIKTRTLLRSASKGERTIVDSVKQIIDHLSLGFQSNINSFCVHVFDGKNTNHLLGVVYSDGCEGEERETEFSINEAEFDKVLQFLKQILERSEIRRFDVEVVTRPFSQDKYDLTLISEMIEAGPPLRVSQLDIRCQRRSDVQMAILKKCDANILKTIYIGNLLHLNRDTLEMIFNVPQMITAEKIGLTNFHQQFSSAKHGVVAIIHVVNRWLSENETIDKEISLRFAPKSTLQFLESKFAERIIRKNEENWAICLRMDNPEKHLWLKISPRDFLQCFTVTSSSTDPLFKGMDFLRIGLQKLKKTEMTIAESLRDAFAFHSTQDLFYMLSDARPNENDYNNYYDDFD